MVKSKKANRLVWRRNLATPKALVRAAALTVISVSALLVNSPPASAGADCSLVGCSTTVNDSAHSVYAYRNWCRDNDSTGDSTETYPSCKVDNVAQTSRYLSPGDNTPRKEDWDTFRVDAGWCYKVYFNRLWAPSFTRTYDRRGKSALYVKVGDEAIAHIQAQSNSTCP
ncbi:hypothetical protein [Microtetraspora niveoalba]|uniref:hypothetical protein n=1 Tax=Microtetraspora niveoalba TaxID=46175 RepID=UPI000ABE537C|nr:hypothetical protein [Microtetraspora niveoalba]